MSDVHIDVTTRANLQGFQQLDAAERAQLLQLKQIELATKQAEAAQAMYSRAAVQANEQVARSTGRVEDAVRRRNAAYSQRIDVRHGAGTALTQEQRREFRQFAENHTGGPAPASVMATQMALNQRTAAAEGVRQQRAAMREADRARQQHETWVRDIAPGQIGGVSIDMARRAVRNADVNERARRFTARRIGRTPELAGRVTEDEFDLMAAANARRLNERLAGGRERMAEDMRRFGESGDDASSHTRGYGTLGQGPIRTPVQRRQQRNDRLRAMASRAGDTLGGVARVAGIGGAVGGTMIAREYFQQQAALGDSLVDLERKLAPIYGVGENAVRRISIRQDVFAKSIASGLSVDVVAEAVGRLGAIGADLPEPAQKKIISQALSASSLGVQDISGFALGINALQRTYAPDSQDPKRTQQLINKWFNAADRGGVDVDSFTPYLSSIAQSSKAAGYSENDMFALTEVTSKAAMRDETLSQTVRNLPLKMIDATRMGKMVRTGSLMGDLSQIKGMSAEQQVDIFGLENVTGAKFVLDNLEGIKAAQAAAAATTGETSVIDTKRTKMLSDPAAMTGRIIGSAKQTSANAEAIAASTPGMATNLERKALSDAGIDLAWADQGPIVKESQRFLADTARMFGGKWGESYEQTGVLFQNEQLEKEGKTAESAALKLRYGKWFGLKNSRHEYTTETDARDYEQTAAKFAMPDLNPSVFLKWQGSMGALPAEDLKKKLAIDNATAKGTPRAKAENDYRMANDPKYRDSMTIKPNIIDPKDWGTAAAPIDAIMANVEQRRKLLGADDPAAAAGYTTMMDLGNRLESIKKDGKVIDPAKDKALQEEAAQSLQNWTGETYEHDLKYYDTQKHKLESTVRRGGPGAIEARRRLGIMNKTEGEVTASGPVDVLGAARLRAAADGRQTSGGNPAQDAASQDMVSAGKTMLDAANILKAAIANMPGAPKNSGDNTTMPKTTPPASGNVGKGTRGAR